MSTLIDDTLTTAPIDAASVILVRQSKQTNELQTLLLCRGKSQTVMNNAWVFPGGKVDPTDYDRTHTLQDSLKQQAPELLNEPELSNKEACALFYAACRETHEETGVTLAPSALNPWSRWITPTEPSTMKKRFDARFFIAVMPPNQTAQHDGQEATDSQWCTPKEAITKYTKNKWVLAPPQIMTLLALARFTHIDQALKAAQTTVTYHIRPVVIKSGNNRTLTYPGDQQHPESMQHMPGPTRLIWCDNHFQPPNGFDPYLQ